MAYPFNVTVNFDILADCHIEAATKPGELEAIGIDPTNATQQIQISHITTEELYKDLRLRLKQTLNGYQLEEHEDHFLYLYYLFIEFSSPDFLYNEELVKHASSTTKKLIELVKIHEETNARDRSITIRSYKKGYTATFDQPLTIEYVWDDLYRSLIRSTVLQSGNPLLIHSLGGETLTVELLKDFASTLKVRTGAFWNKSLAEFAATLLYYLNKRNIFKGQSNLSSQQARLIYDILKAFGILNHEKIKSVEDDYLKALLRNNGFL